MWYLPEDDNALIRRPIQNSRNIDNQSICWRSMKKMCIMLKMWYIIEYHELFQVVKEELSVETKKFGDGSLEFDFELDLDFNEFESFEFPEIFNGRYFHDFKVRGRGRATLKLCRG